MRPDEDYSMRMYNSDGTEPEMCGNGIRQEPAVNHFTPPHL